MASGKSGKDRNAQEARERARLYQARLEFHEAQRRRRVRDNVLVGVVGGLLVIGAVASQFVYYGVGPGAPTPTPTETAPVEPAPTEPTDPAPSESAPSDPAPTPTESTPSPTASPSPSDTAPTDATPTPTPSG